MTIDELVLEIQGNSQNLTEEELIAEIESVITV